MPLDLLPTHAPGEIITASWANTLQGNVGQLDGRTGGDPSALGLFLASTSTTQAAWRLLASTDFWAGLVPSTALADQKVNITSPGYLTFAAALAGGSGFFDVLANPDGPDPSHGWFLIQSRIGNWAAGDYRFQLAVAQYDPNLIYLRLIVNASPTAWVKLWHAGNDGLNSGLDAGLLAGMSAGNANGQIPINNGVLNTNLNANLLNGMNTGNGPGNVIPVNNGIENGNLNAALLNGLTAAQIASSGSAGGFPAGGVAIWPGTAATIPSTWIRHANASGRILIGDGTSFSQTFTAQNNYGSTWAHGHAMNSYTPGGSVVIVLGTSGTSSSANTATGGGTHADIGDHGHGVTSQTFTGNAATLTMQDTTVFQPMRCVIYMEKS